MTWCLALGTGSALAEQPIFDEMPRWSGGYGVQLLCDYRHNALEDPSNSLSDAVVEKRVIVFMCKASTLGSRGSG